MTNILIVDDEPLQRLLVREILCEHHTFSFFESAGGAHALRLAQQHRLQVIIFGLRLPQLDKFDAFERLRTVPDRQPIPLIVTTTGPRTDPNVKVLLARGHPVLIKPFEPEELQAAVCQVLLRVGVQVAVN